ncbi:MAG: hypothetical protein RL708_1907 [Bacteroidota bacterium]|jgi:rhodanese-related sulfurtransferase
MSKNILFVVICYVFSFFVSCQNSNSTAKKINETILVKEFQEKLNQSTTHLLVDVRTPEEYIGGHLQNSININYNDVDFKNKIQKLDKSKPIFIYCLSGGRSSNAATDMGDMGFVEIYNMKGGIISWRNANLPIVTNSNTVEKGLTLDEFTKMVTNEKFVLVDFNAKWCKPCKEMMPMIDKIAVDKTDKLILKKIDADINSDLLQAKKIESIPYFELYKNGKLVWHHAGTIDEKTFLEETKL